MRKQCKLGLVIRLLVLMSNNNVLSRPIFLISLKDVWHEAILIISTEHEQGTLIVVYFSIYFVEWAAGNRTVSVLT